MGEAPLAVTHLVYRYGRAGRPAVDGLDFAVGSGEIVGLLGPNGAGKTTTLHAILGLLAPTAGGVTVFGCSPLHERSRVMPRLNFASVDVDLPSNLLVAECLRIFAKLYGVHRDARHYDELMERFRLIELRRRRIGALSAGEQMRLKLCKALLNRPDLLILDEPTLNLDPYMAQTVRDLLMAIQRERGMSILHTSHNMREVESFCDRILFLHQGRKLAEGPPHEVLARFGSRSLDELFIRVATSGELYSHAS
jgi:ABC-2 type transport system ATP-binding protein